MNEQLLRLYVWQLTFRPTRLRPRDERGEGVVSMAIAVLIMAFLGVLVWAGFRMTLQNAQTKVDDQVEQIGR
jgi:hypothetical protein